MKTKGFTLVEMLVAMSLMGLILTMGGRLYQHLQSSFLRSQAQEEMMIAQLQARQILMQDWLESTEVLEMSDSSLCLLKHPFDPPLCYLWRDSLLLRQREGDVDTVGERLNWKSWAMPHGRQEISHGPSQNLRAVRNDR